MTDIKSEKLRLSVQGLKTQQRYLRERIDKLEEQMTVMQQQFDKLSGRTTLLVVSIHIFYAILILGFLMRRYG